MDSKITAIAKLQEQVQYQNAILEAQKSFCAIYNSHFNLEYCSGSFSSFMLGSCDRKNFSLVKKLLPYNKNKIPSTDKELVKVLEEVDELKACFELQHGNSITEEFIFSITLS